MTLSLINLVAVLLAAWTAGALVRRLGYPAVLGEILAGVFGLRAWARADDERHKCLGRNRTEFTALHQVE